MELLPVTHLPGVGQAKESALAELGIRTVQDLLHHFPFRYEDRSLRPFHDWQDGESVTARGVVEGTPSVTWKNGRSICSVSVRIEQQQRVRCVWFNQHYLKAKLKDGRFLTLRGKYDARFHTLTVSHTSFSASEPDEYSELTPVYRAVQGLSSYQLHRLIKNGLERHSHLLTELLPHFLLEKYRLVSHKEAVIMMHDPRSSEDLRQAHRRLAFEEFFVFQLQVQFRRTELNGHAGHARRVPDGILEGFCTSLPYSLTNAQRKACGEILSDITSPRPMRRLLQGDVGSGKTWVALFAAYAVSQSGAQTALMAPTELLAEQHFKEASKILTGGLGVKVGLVTGSTPLKERTEITAALTEGGLQVIVGTHALLSDDVVFHELGLVITDEQHRFGVLQRGNLLQKGSLPDVLAMSATPIPRTLAMAVYGDLDVSELYEKPQGRIPIQTRCLSIGKEDEVVRFVRRELSRSHQAYVVAPLIEDSEQMAEVASATALTEHLREQFAGYEVALLHGRMTASEKDEVMRSFGEGRIPVLVSTTVIEVGIDVPNATVMVIYHAERFGLAQLHQLRGRVGRGSAQSYCILLSDKPSEVGKQRLATMVNTTDGFVIAQKDLELRGPGEFLGIRQSGLPEFTVGDLSRDLNIMVVARREALAMMEDRDFWLLPAYQGLRETLEMVSGDSPTRA